MIKFKLRKNFELIFQKIKSLFSFSENSKVMLKTFLLRQYLKGKQIY